MATVNGNISAPGPAICLKHCFSTRHERCRKLLQLDVGHYKFQVTTVSLLSQIPIHCFVIDTQSHQLTLHDTHQSETRLSSSKYPLFIYSKYKHDSNNKNSHS